MTALDPGDHRKLIASLRVVASDKDGECNAALMAAVRIVRRYDLDLAEIVERGLTHSSPAAPSSPVVRDPATFWSGGDWLSPWRRKAKAILTSRLILDDGELKFVRKMADLVNEPTLNQRDWLDSIHWRMVPARRAA